VPDRPLRADAQRNREKVLRAATEAFAASGYGVPLDEIAALAGVGPGTVYRHFPTKEALFEAVATARVESLAADARARADAADPGQAFFAFLARIGREAAAKRDLPDAITITGPLQENLFAAVDVLLSRAQQAGAVRTDIGTADLIVLVKGLIMSIQEAPAGATGLRLSNLAFALLSDGLRASEGGRRGNGHEEDPGEGQDK
jgi:AcrR family transcriptional regulator